MRLREEVPTIAPSGRSIREVALLERKADKETAEFIQDFQDFTEEGIEYEKQRGKAIKTLGFSIKDLREFLREGDSLGTWGKPSEKDRLCNPYHNPDRTGSGNHIRRQSPESRHRSSRVENS